VSSDKVLDELLSYALAAFADWDGKSPAFEGWTRHHV
jgi:hypothetical protein